MGKFCSECGRANVVREPVAELRMFHESRRRWGEVMESASKVCGDAMLCPVCGVNSRPVGMGMCSECRGERSHPFCDDKGVHVVVDGKGVLLPWGVDRREEILLSVAAELSSLQTDGSVVRWEDLPKLARVAMSKVARLDELESREAGRKFDGLDVPLVDGKELG